MATLDNITPRNSPIDPLSPAAQDYVRVHRLCALCETPSGLRVLLPTEKMQLPETARVLWCPSVAARQIEIEVAKGSSVEDAAGKYGVELIAHERVLIRAKWRALRGMFGGPRTSR